MSSTYKGIETEWETVMVPKAAKTTAASKTAAKTTKTEDSEDFSNSSDEETTKPVGQRIGKCVINLQEFVDEDEENL